MMNDEEDEEAEARIAYEHGWSDGSNNKREYADYYSYGTPAWSAYYEALNQSSRDDID